MFPRIPAIRILLSIMLLLSAALDFPPAFAAENFIVLPTELKISSVSVSIRAPLGFHYRPGDTFPLEIHVTNPGSPLDLEITATEGSEAGNTNTWVERAVLPSVALPSGTSRFELSMRAPGVSANIVLILRGGSGEGGKAELFRASLSRVFHPLASGGRVVIFCGNGPATVWPQDQAARLSARELLAEDWKWESVDWVVLNDASIKEATPEAVASLHRWLSGGGRLLLRSREAFTAALSLGLLPLNPQSDVRAEVSWWQKNADFTNDDVLALKNFRPVYARLHQGFGQIAFLFPGSQPADADEAAVFNRPDLQRHRNALPDQRIQPERFNAFAPSSAGESKRRTVMLWATLGALIFCAGLFYARSSRSKIEAALVPVGAGALLMMLLGNGFPRNALTVTRVMHVRESADGTVIVRNEWAFLEAFQQPVLVSARGQKNGIFEPRFDELDDLRIAGLNRSIQNQRPTLERISIAPNQPAMLYASRIDTLTQPSSAETGVALKLSNSKKKLQTRSKGMQKFDLSRLIWIAKSGEISILQKSANESAYRATPFTLRELENSLGRDNDATVAKARAAALKVAADDAAKEGDGVVIAWKSMNELQEPPLIDVEGAAASEGNDFLIGTFGVSESAAAN